MDGYQRMGVTSLVQQAQTHDDLLRLMENQPILNAIHADAILRRMVALQKNQAITSAGLKVINAFGYCCNFVINDGNAELRQIVGVLWASAKLKFPDIYGMLGRIESRIVSLRSQTNDQAVSNTLFALSLLGVHPSEGIMEVLLSYLRAQGRSFSAQAAINTLQALARMNLRTEFLEAAALFDDVFLEYADREEITSPAAASLFSAFAAVRAPLGGSTLSALMTVCRTRANLFDAPAVATTLISLARLGHRAETDECAHFLEDRLLCLSFSLSQATNVLLAFAKTGNDPADAVFDRMCTCMVQHLRLNPAYTMLIEEAVFAVGALAELGRAPSEGPLVDLLVQTLAARIATADKDLLVDLVSNVARLSVSASNLLTPPKTKVQSSSRVDVLVTQLLRSISASFGSSASAGSGSGPAPPSQTRTRKQMVQLAEAYILLSVAHRDAHSDPSDSDSQGTAHVRVHVHKPSEPEDQGVSPPPSGPFTTLAAADGGHPDPDPSEPKPHAMPSAGDVPFSLGPLEQLAFKEIAAEGRVHFTRDSSTHKLVLGIQSHAGSSSLEPAAEGATEPRTVIPAINVSGCCHAVVADLFFPDSCTAVLLAPASECTRRTRRPLGSLKVREALARAAGWRVALLREDELSQLDTDAARFAAVLSAVHKARPILQGTPIALPDVPAPPEYDPSVHSELSRSTLYAGNDASTGFRRNAPRMVGLAIGALIAQDGHSRRSGSPMLRLSSGGSGSGGSSDSRGSGQRGAGRDRGRAGAGSNWQRLAQKPLSTPPAHRFGHPNAGGPMSYSNPGEAGPGFYHSATGGRAQRHSMPQFFPDSMGGSMMRLALPYGHYGHGPSQSDPHDQLQGGQRPWVGPQGFRADHGHPNVFFPSGPAAMYNPQALGVFYGHPGAAPQGVMPLNVGAGCDFGAQRYAQMLAMSQGFFPPAMARPSPDHEQAARLAAYSYERLMDPAYRATVDVSTSCLSTPPLSPIPSLLAMGMGMDVEAQAQAQVQLQVQAAQAQAQLQVQVAQAQATAELANALYDMQQLSLSPSSGGC